MMLLVKLLLLISTSQVVDCCFCPPPITPSCGCSSNNYASSPSLQPQTIFYTNPIPVNGPIQPSYGQPPPIYVQSSYYPVGSQYPPQPGYAMIPPSPLIQGHVVQNPVYPYQPRAPVVRPYQPTPNFSPDPVIPPPIEQVKVVPSQPEATFTARVVENPTPVQSPPKRISKPSITEDFETEDEFEIIRPAQTTPHSVLVTSTISSSRRTESFTPSSTVDEVEELEISDTTTSKPHDSTTRIVPIPRKEGDGKSDDYEYFYIYYDDDKNQTSVDKNRKNAAVNEKAADKTNDFEDFDDDTRDIAKETSVLDAGKVELDGTDYNVLEVNAIRRNIKTNYINKTSRKFTQDTKNGDDVKENTTPPPYSDDDYEEYEVEELVPVNPDGTEGKPQIIKVLSHITSSTVAPETHEGVYKRANTFHGISKTARTKLVDVKAKPSHTSGTEMSSRKILRANRRKLNDGEVRRHSKP